VEVADATEAQVAASLLDRYDPGVLVLVAGADPVIAPLHEHSWESFSVNWNSDVRIAFTWLGEALRRPLRPGSRIVVVSSGAARHGSPASGGYAGAKATQRFLADYTREESRRDGLGLTVTAVLPMMTPHGAVGRSGIRAYAARSGKTEEQFVAGLGDVLTPETAGSAVVQLVQADPASVAPAYLLGAAGLKELP
jgi:NAD(P)-dependent dehydrogenase (short-subunit alcohol dehydrogenase family)